MVTWNIFDVGIMKIIEQRLEIDIDWFNNVVQFKLGYADEVVGTKFKRYFNLSRKIKTRNYCSTYCLVKLSHFVIFDHELWISLLDITVHVYMHICA